jgi:hypothetical protein
VPALCHFWFQHLRHEEKLMANSVDKALLFS